MSTVLTRGAEGLDRRGFSFAEVEAMLDAGVIDPDEKFEVIDGEIVPMNAQNMPHMMWKARINRWLVENLPRSFVIVPEGTIRLRDEPRANVFETDLLVFEPVDGADAIRAPMVRLAIEIADTSRHRDVAVKAPRYGQHGVAELWVVDVSARTVLVHRAPGPLGYGDIRELAFEAGVSPLFLPDVVLTLAGIE
jgi:Uma2 family endonuclease